MGVPIIIAGTRPELIKMAPIALALKKTQIHYKFLYTGQHHDFELSRTFISDLGLPRPDYNLGIKAGYSATLTGEVFIRTAEAIRELDPALALVQGDTNTALAATIAAIKEKVPVCHVESGLRSYDWRMPEEHNRRMIDHVSSYLFAPTERALLNLFEEKAPGTKHVTGNTVIDATIDNMPRAEFVSRISEKIRFEEYVLATAHRAENVDDPEVLQGFVEVFQSLPLPVVFPVHPRTVNRLKSLGLLQKLASHRNVQLLPPLGYFDFLVLMKRSALILTDSGGVQEEATSPPIRKRVVVMRNSTERPEAVEWGFAKIAGTRKQDIIKCATEMLESNTALPETSPFGDGSSGETIGRLVTEMVTSQRIHEFPQQPLSQLSIISTPRD